MVSTYSIVFLTSSTVSYKWYVDSVATEHVTNRHEWFTNFNSIDEGVWQVIVVDNETVWVRSRGDIKIIRYVNGRQLLGILRNVIYIQNLARNLLSIGTISNVGIIFLFESLTQPNNCEFQTKHGDLIMEASKLINYMRFL